MPKISVIIPTLNEEKYLPKALKSLEVQDVKHEVIVVDGGSTDKTLDIAEEFGAKVIVAERSFIAYQKNLGVKKAKGKHLLFLDADTFLFPFALDELLQEFKEKEAIRVKFFLYGNESWVDMMNALMPFYFSLSKTLPLAVGACFAIKRKLFLELGGFPPVINEDAEFGKILHKKKLVKNSKHFLAMTSARRFEQKGFLRTALYYMKNNLGDTFSELKKFINVGYEPVR